MKKFMKSLSVFALAGAMTLGTGMTAFAADITTDQQSKFTIAGDTTSASTGITEFYLIKDYDSKNPTAAAPKSKSPAETFEYTITPYAVWNAGSTYASSGAGAATKIDKDNMPMLFAETSVDNDYVAVPNGTNTTRQLVIKQHVQIGDAKYEATDDKENKDEKETLKNYATIKLPTYNTVGDYWYQVEETLGDTTGVLYGTNSVNLATNVTAENGGHNRTYYIHVQVTETIINADSSAETVLVKNVTMHTTAPDPDSAQKTDAQYNAFVSDEDGKFYKNDTNATHKVNAIENRYYAGDLVIKKEVTGNAGDKSKYFKVTVVFTKPAGTLVNSDIPFTAYLLNGSTYTSTDITIKGQYYPGEADTTTLKWTRQDTLGATATATFYVKDNDTVTFSNIPYGINYSIVEEQPANDTYQNRITFTNSKEDGTVTFDAQGLLTDTDAKSGALDNDFTKAAVGSISDPHDEVTIENNKTTIIDIGVLINNAPFIALLVIAGAVTVVYLCRRKRTIGE